MQRPYSILIVDDDPEIRALVQSYLARNGMHPVTAHSVPEAEEKLAQCEIDLIVLDLMMQGEDGLSFCKRLRTSSQIPVIMLTALSEDIDRIVGLEVGADDYLGKPFNPRELVARIKAIMRRTEAELSAPTRPQSTTLRFGPFRLIPDQMALLREPDDEIHLTSGEFALLLALVERAPRVLSRDALLDLSRGAQANPFDRSIDSQISRIRSKIEADPRRPVYIKTVRNLGYACAADVTRDGA
ncbi:MAG: response regulator [Pseudomonadota bacterium]